MHVCSQCATTVDLSRYGFERYTCPDCGGALRDVSDCPWTSVARVRNLAEAGFLSDELIGLGIDARIHQLDRFNTAGDRRAAAYMICVPTQQTQEAAARIRDYLDEPSDDEPQPAAYGFSPDAHANEPFPWRPVALVILAGVASFVLGQRFSDRNGQVAERRPIRNSLAAAVEAIGQPFVADQHDGKPRYRLTFDRRREAWALDVDRDGDGVFDSRRAFRASGAAW